jgi:hypothetical protein
MPPESELDSLEVVRAHADALRTAIETMPRAHWPSLASSPQGACGDTALLIAQYFADVGLGDWDYVSGERWVNDHEWRVNRDVRRRYAPAVGRDVHGRHGASGASQSSPRARESRPAVEGTARRSVASAGGSSHYLLWRRYCEQSEGSTPPLRPLRPSRQRRRARHDASMSLDGSKSRAFGVPRAPATSTRSQLRLRQPGAEGRLVRRYDLRACCARRSQGLVRTRP